MEKYEKVYVEVLTRVCEDGQLLPVRMIWAEQPLDIVEVRSVRMCPAKHVGGMAYRYTCVINGGEHDLFMEEYPKLRWFVERRVA